MTSAEKAIPNSVTWMNDNNYSKQEELMMM